MSLFRKDKVPESIEEPKPLPDRATGKITYLSDKGWGFISSLDIKFERIFFHWQGLSGVSFKDLKKGMKVEFTPKKYDDKGFRAVKVKVL